MRTGRADFDAIFRVSTIPGDEPLFYLRAQDVNASAAVRDWAARHVLSGGSAALAESALDQADAMDRWPTKKLPGDDHLTEHERLQLEYEFKLRIRRKAGDDVDLNIVFAEARGAASALLALEAPEGGRDLRNVIIGIQAQKIELLEQALKSWSCPSCGGSGVHRWQDQEGPCKVCTSTGLHPSATAALKADPSAALPRDMVVPIS